MWRDVARLGGGTAVGQLAVVATTPLLTRLYTPQAFGQLGLVLAFSSVAMVIVGLRYDLAIASARDEHEADGLLGVALLSCIPTSAAAGLALWFMIHHRSLGFGGLPESAAPVVAVLLLATGGVMSLRYWNVRRFRFREVGIAAALQGAGRALVPLLLAVANPGWWGLLAGDATGRVLGAARLASGAIPRVTTLSARQMATVARRYLRYPLVVLPSSLVDAMAVAVPLPIISAFFGVAAAGQFALVQRVAALPASLVAASFADVIHAEGSRLQQGGVDSLRPLAAQSFRRLGLVGAAIYLPVLLLAPVVFPVLFGSEWTEAGIAAAILAPFLWLTVVVSPLSRLILVSGRTDLKLLADVVCLLVPAAALFAARNEEFRVALVAYAAASALAYLVYLGIIWRAAGRQRPLSDD
jgi:O-antigen/teichoic acid export membrane protein